ncbi:hypothetical protein CBR_g54504 [Chara braunii]|uniref:Retrotransposon gag domain-containing protein n=1 Tax=Chara braunii TaxID=69332 RepID=A0A388MCB7_CHABU|nr:hypothetical protein CBR_g54504 [Chara braunii]|eukprot:GBG92153.1 hypothetical protein CBR_g54504 [Chara braunii]
MGFINHTDLKLDKDVRAAISEDSEWATFRKRLSRTFAFDDISYSIDDIKKMKKEERETLVVFARRFETASEPLIENGFLSEIERCGTFIGTLPIKKREFVMENMPTKGVSFAKTKALALQTGGPDAKAHLLRVLEKLRKEVPGSHLGKQFVDEDEREFMPPDKGRSCEKDSDAALVCAKKVSEESDENEADNTSLDNKVSPRGEGPKVIQETWEDQTTTLEVKPKIEECGRLKKIGDTHSKGTGDSDTSYEFASAFKFVEPDIRYELAQLSETIEPDVSNELAQLFGTIEQDGDYDLAKLFEASESDIDYGLTQLFETVDKYKNNVENSLETTMSRNLATTKDIEGSRMDQCKLISKCDVMSIEGEFIDCLGGQRSDNPLAFDQEGEERTMMEVKIIADADSPENKSMRIMKMSGLEERLEAEKPAVDVKRFEDKDLVKTENWIAG